MSTQRQLKVGEEIRHALARVLERGGFHWPDGLGEAIVTVTEVRVSPDLQNATAFVMPLGGRRIKDTVDALNDGSGFFRHAVAKAIKLRRAPSMNFMADTTFEYVDRIERAIKAANKTVNAD